MKSARISTPRPQSIVDQILSYAWLHRGVIAGIVITTTLLVFVCGYIGGVQYQMLKSGYGVDYSIGASMVLGYGPGKAQTISTFVAMQLLHVIFLYLIPAKKKRIKDERDIEYSDTGTYGTAGFMSDDELHETFNVTSVEDADGFIVGKKGSDIISLPRESHFNRHMAVYGASGSRKSRSLIRPMIFQSIKAGESVIVTDPKGELYADTATLLRKCGYTVRVFNLVDQNCSDSWNCLEEIAQSVDNAEVFADVIVRNISQDSANKFWNDAAKNLLKALALLVNTDKEARENGKATMGELYRILVTYKDSELKTAFDGLKGENGEQHPAIWPYKIYAGATETIRESVRHGLGIMLGAFQSKSTREITEHPEIDLKLPCKEKCAYFVIISDQNRAMDFMSSLFFSFLFIKQVGYVDRECEDKSKLLHVNYLLDEYVNIGAISDIERKISVLRSRKINLCLVFQAIPQLPIDTYEILLGNCDTHVVLGVNDLTTAEYVSKRSGIAGIIQHSDRESRAKYAPFQIVPLHQVSEGEGQRVLLNVDEVMRMHNDESLVIVRSKPILKVEKFDFTEHPYAPYMEEENASKHVPEWRAKQEAKAEAIKQRRANAEAKKKAAAEAKAKQETKTSTPEQAQSDPKPESQKQAAPKPEPKPEEQTEKIAREESISDEPTGELTQANAPTGLPPPTKLENKRKTKESKPKEAVENPDKLPQDTVKELAAVLKNTRKSLTTLPDGSKNIVYFDDQNNVIRTAKAIVIVKGDCEQFKDEELGIIVKRKKVIKSEDTEKDQIQLNIDDMKTEIGELSDNKM